uniref:PFGI-1 class ICE element type IV pilus protein PilL2 n=1 Tax=Sinimarinibacterium flocculans TaxID=985250 RepID=UPI001FE9D90E|nr:PilL N-terminal domain-containing protein [Sinimarinibacterium flocculans]
MAALCFLVGGCATAPVVPPAPEVPVQEPTPDEHWIPIVRYGRYTLVELVPETAQQDLMLQVIDISLSNVVPQTVGVALDHVLRRSGYRLCDIDTQMRVFYELPLPAVHQRLGPLFLHDALLTLAGPAWDLQVDDAERRVCFARQEDAESAVDDTPVAVDTP